MCWNATAKWDSKTEEYAFVEGCKSITILYESSNFFWVDAILTACYLINRMPTKVLKYDTPFKILEKSFPTSKHLFSSLQPCIFGCTSYVHDHNSTKSKLDPHALKCVFLCYSPYKGGFKCYHPPSRIYLVSLNIYLC